MIKNEPDFISASDYFNYWGVDLNALLKDEDNTSNKVNIFLRYVENRVKSWIDANTFRIYEYEKLGEQQLENFQLALLHQAKYMLRSGDIGMDSGYDPDKGPVAQRDYLNKIEICQPCLDYLTSAGLNNHTIKNVRRHFKTLL